MVREHISQWFFNVGWSTYELVAIEAETITVLIYDFWVGSGYPGYQEERHYDKAYLIYEGVIESTRQIGEYIDNKRKDFRREYTIIDGPFSTQQEGEIFLFIISSVFIDINAWVEWEIKAKNIRIHEIS